MVMHFFIFVQDLPTSTKSAELDDFNTQSILKGTEIECASMHSLIPLYLGYLSAVGFIEKTPDLPCLEIWGKVKDKGMVGRNNS